MQSQAEKQESERTYPDLLKTLKEEKDSQDAVRIIEFAIKAEIQHAALFNEALINLGQNRETSYFVCPVCSYVSTGKPGNTCDGCQCEKRPIQTK